MKESNTLTSAVLAYRDLFGAKDQITFTVEEGIPELCERQLIITIVPDLDQAATRIALDIETARLLVVELDYMIAAGDPEEA